LQRWREVSDARFFEMRSFASCVWHASVTRQGPVIVGIRTITGSAGDNLPLEPALNGAAQLIKI